MRARPRDRIDYSAIPDREPLALPDGKRVAVWVIVNIENWDIEKPMPRTVLSPPGNQVHVPDIPNWSWQEYGMRVGFWRLHEVLVSRGIPVTMSVNGSVCVQYPRIAGAARDAGWEFLGHGYWQRPTHLIEDQREDIRRTIDAIRDFTGRAPRGWMGPGLTENESASSVIGNIVPNHPSKAGAFGVPAKCGEARMEPVVESYNCFLDFLGDLAKRKHLETLDRSKRDDECFREIKNEGHHFTRELLKLFESTFDSTHPIRRAVVI